MPRDAVSRTANVGTVGINGLDTAIQISKLLTQMHPQKLQIKGNLFKKIPSQIDENSLYKLKLYEYCSGTDGSVCTAWDYAGLLCNFYSLAL